MKKKIYKAERPSMAKLLPKRSYRTVRIDHMNVTEKQAKWEALKAAISGGDRYAYTKPGKYAALLQMDKEYGERMWMSDTDMEWITNVGFIHMCKGDVLIFGLGMGFVLPPIMKNPAVKTITVVEKNRDVIRLIEPFVMKWPHARKVTIVEGDAFTWSPVVGPFDVIYFDIWPIVDGKNWPEMKKLKQRYKKHLKARDDKDMSPPRISCWRQYDCQRMYAEDNRWDRLALASVGGKALASL